MFAIEKWRPFHTIEAWTRPPDLDWSSLGFPVIDRGHHAIFPLAAVPARWKGEAVDWQLASDRHELTRAFVHFFGGDDFHSESALDPESGYGRKLVEAGAVVTGSRWECLWFVDPFAVVLVHTVDAGGAFETLALHVMPRDWADYRGFEPKTARERSRYRRMLEDRAAADVRWAWDDTTASGEG